MMQKATPQLLLKFAIHPIRFFQHNANAWLNAKTLQVFCERDIFVAVLQNLPISEKVKYF